MPFLKFVPDSESLPLLVPIGKSGLYGPQNDA